jgi:hypothetical protein
MRIKRLMQPSLSALKCSITYDDEENPTARKKKAPENNSAPTTGTTSNQGGTDLHVVPESSSASTTGTTQAMSGKADPKEAADGENDVDERCREAESGDPMAIDV